MSLSSIAVSFVDIGANLNPLKAGLAEVEGLVASSTMGGLASLGAALGIGAGIGAIAIKGLSMAMESAANDRRLSAMLTMAGEDAETAMDKISKFADSVALVTKFDDDLVKSLYSQALAFKMTSAQADIYVRNAIGLAKLKNISPEEALGTLVQAGYGKTKGLQMLLPELRGITDQTEMLAKAGEAAARGMKIPDQDQWGLFKYQIEEITKAFGQMENDAVQPLLKSLNKLAYTFRTFKSDTGSSKEVTGMWKSAGGGLGTVLSDLVFNFMKLGEYGMLLGQSVALGLSIIGDSVAFVFDNMGAVGKWALDNLVEMFSAVGTYAAGIFKSIYNNIVNAFQAAFDYITNLGTKPFKFNAEGFADFKFNYKEFKGTKFETGDMSNILADGMAKGWKDLRTDYNKWDNSIKTGLTKAQKEANDKLGKVPAPPVLGKTKGKKEDEGSVVAITDVWKKLQDKMFKDSAEKDQLNATKGVQGEVKKIGDKICQALKPVALVG